VPTILALCLMHKALSSSCPASQVLGQGAVHASFAAYTGFSVSMLKTHFVLLPTRYLNKARGCCFGYTPYGELRYSIARNFWEFLLECGSAGAW
jgi:hypothetical protein